MLGRMITGSLVLTKLAPPPQAADFIVANDAQWDAVFANSAAALVGKIVEVAAPASAFTARTISNEDVWTAGGRLTIRSANSGSGIPALTLSGTVRGIDFSGLNIQIRGWPAIAGSCVYFAGGTFGKLRFLSGTTMRHGYGAGLANIDTTAQYPEYDRIDNVQTATTTSQTFPLTWKDPAATSGIVEVFNRGAATVYVATGNAGVVATTGSTAVAAGTRVRLAPRNPTTATHFAILAASGTVQVNARAEIGLGVYLASAFASSGAAVMEDITIRNCLFRDLSDGIKGIAAASGDFIIMDNDLDRIYADCLSPSITPTGRLFVLRNMESLAFARSGIAENLNGDAGDPHGGSFQMSGTGAGTLGPVYYAGNRQRVIPRRAGASHGGMFFSDNDVSPSYNGIFSISTMQIGGSTTSTVVGEGSAFPVADALFYGQTNVKFDDAASTNPQFNISKGTAGQFYAGKVISPNIAASVQPILQDGTLDLTDVANPAAVFPNLANLATAATRAQIEAAMLPSADGLGLGMNAAINAIDWTTADPEAVIRWENVPSGVYWDALVNQAANTVITLPLRKVLNLRAAQAVSVGAGTEWRKVAADGVTELQAWTTSSGTIEQGQFIQIRRTSGDFAATVAASVTINGFTVSAGITSVQAPPSAFLVMPATIAHFGDTAVLPASTTRLTWRGKFYFPAGTISDGQALFSQVSDGCDLRTFGNGFRVIIEDGTQTQVLGGLTVRLPGKLVADTWLDIVLDVNQTARTVTLTINGDTEVIPFTIPGDGFFNTARRIGFLATQAGSLRLVAGVRCADLSVERNGSLYKAISNTATTANADAWKLGAGGLTN